jgi:hypothetical protein
MERERSGRRRRRGGAAAGAPAAADGSGAPGALALQQLVDTPAAAAGARAGAFVAVHAAHAPVHLQRTGHGFVEAVQVRLNPGRHLDVGYEQVPQARRHAEVRDGGRVSSDELGLPTRDGVGEQALLQQREVLLQQRARARLHAGHVRGTGGEAQQRHRALANVLHQSAVC